LLHRDSAIFLAEQLVRLPSDEHKKWLVNIIGNVQNQGLETPNVEKKHIDLAIKECDHTDKGEPIFSVISAYDVPKFTFNNERKKFMLDTTPKNFLPKALAKAGFIRERYALLWQRTNRHELFSTSESLDGKQANEKYKLSKVEILLSTSKPLEVVVLGYLTQLTEGKFHIEDPTGTVELDLSKAKFHSGLFCEGCFVLADGQYVDGVLRVNGIGFPPPESASNSRAYFGTANTWGGPSKTLLKYSPRLAEIEKANVSDTIAFLSDCWLDNLTVMDKLKALFLGYNECPPIAIVLMGPFSKRTEDPYALKTKFSALGTLLSSCERLKRETDLVLVPASEDPSAANILPRPPIPEHLVSSLRKQFPRLISVTNPCRLQYCTQQIVVCRADLITKFCRNTIKFPKEGLLEEHVSQELAILTILLTFLFISLLER
jgi:DNA polymerase epsilon subunit 2